MAMQAFKKRVKFRLSMKKKRLSRGPGGDIFIFIMLFTGAAFMALPLVYTVCNAFKPIDELFVFPPQFFVRQPTLDNFFDLATLMRKSWVPLSRYIANSLLIVGASVFGNVFLGSLAAYALSKHTFPGKSLINNLILFSLMFAGGGGIDTELLDYFILGLGEHILGSYCARVGFYSGSVSD